MDLMRYQPNIDRFETDCRISQEEGKNNKGFKREKLKDLLYEYSRKPDSKLSVQDLQEYFVRRGGDPNHKLSESEIAAIRSLLNVWRRDGDLLRLPYKEIEKILFVSDDELIRMHEDMIPQIIEWQKDAVYRQCGVCMRKVKHLDSDCPYFQDVPDPDTAEVGEGYVIFCIDCNCADHGHEPGTWDGYAFPKGRDRRYMTKADESSSGSSDGEA